MKQDEEDEHVRTYVHGMRDDGIFGTLVHRHTAGRTDIVVFPLQCVWLESSLLLESLSSLPSSRIIPMSRCICVLGAHSWRWMPA